MAAAAHTQGYRVNQFHPECNAPASSLARPPHCSPGQAWRTNVSTAAAPSHSMTALHELYGELGEQDAVLELVQPGIL